jgi:hypothetical protein
VRDEPGAPRRALASAGRVTYWRRSGLIDPDRGELRQLKIVAALRRAGLSGRRVRAALEHLRLGHDGDDVPVAIAVHGREVYVRHRDGSWEGDLAPGQLVFAEFLTLRPLDVDALPPPESAAPESAAPESPAGDAAGPRRTGGDGAAAIRDYLARERALDTSGPEAEGIDLDPRLLGEAYDVNDQ